MLINGIELSSLGVTLYDRVLSTNSVDTASEWLDGDIQPTFVRQQDQFKKMKLSFLILSKNEEEAFLTISRLTALIKKSSIRFDDMNLLFETTLVGEAKEERLKNGSFVVTYNLISDYAQGEREIYTTDANATNAFKLNILYYQNDTVLIAQEDISLRAGAFKDDGTNTLESIGINVNKYRPDYYDEGITNLGAYPVTYDNLQRLATLIVNYVPTKYNLTVQYFMDDGTGFYNELYTNTIQFTYPKVQAAATIGQLIDLKTNRPGVNYATRVSFDRELTVENLLISSPIYVYYDKVDAPLEKTITVTYTKELDRGDETLHTGVLYFKETDFYDGLTHNDIFNLDGYRPNPSYYNHGTIVGHELTDLVTFETLETSYTIEYTKTENTIYAEYYLGTYPGWYRLGALPVKIKYHEKFETEGFSLSKFNIDLNKYQASTYTPGTLYNGETYINYDALLNAGIIQIYYIPIDFKIKVRYFKEVTTSEPIAVEDVTINELTFVNNPVLSDVIAITAHRPEGWQFAPQLSYDGEVTLSALTHASPINIVYEEIAQLKTKNVIVKYKQQYKSGFSVINTSILTINEADTIGGVRLKDLINLDAYRPDYYESGIIDNASATALLTFDNILSNYDIVYMATTYTTSVRYFIDEVDELNWIGSSYISYRVIDFELDTTLYNLGFNPNLFKPMYGGNGELQYHGAVNFVALRQLEAINVTYDTETEPDDPDGIDYPHRFLFLQHNDLGNFEHLHPQWTMNHAYINTGVTVRDMSKLTVIMECAPVDKNTRMDYVNANYAYLFGSSSGEGEFYMRFNNQTNYGANLTGVNTYEARAGRHTNKLILTEDNAVGFGANSGIYASERDGYSYVTFTYTNNLESEKTPMPYPLYLFANNNMGSYQGGIANIGIYSCRIYYEGQLIRDMIPVQFYDKIGSQIAPSNCLYDKITQRFFEDGTGMNSFNIIDDERFEDVNPEHKIGKFYVQYMKNGSLFQTATIYMRGSDFIGTNWDPYERLLVDHYQPPYYSSGVITNLDEIKVINFDNINNFIFQVNYEQTGNLITVNYYMDEADDQHLIKSEEIIIKEEDFLQAPTFGDIVRLNKYRPEHYQTDFQYPDTKVTLGRMIDHSPYNIVYTPATDETEYTFKVRYTKKIFGWRTYETIAVDTITLTAPEFRDGEYVDFFFDKNKYRPERFYGEGIPYGYYEMDERLTTPADLPTDELVIRYQPTPQSIAIDYYKDSSELVSSPNPDVVIRELIASTSWTIQIDDFDPRFSINPPDDLPNSYVNKFRPASCQPGQFVDPTRGYTFEELCDEGHIDIVYKAIYQPHDPENDIYEGKILWWGDLGSELSVHGAYFSKDGTGGKLRVHNYDHDGDDYVGGRIPYIDLGYRPNAVERLRVEIKCVAAPEGFIGTVNGRAFQTEDYTYILGYYGTDTMEKLNGGNITTRPSHPELYSYNTNFSPDSAGAFGIRTRIPVASNWVYTTNGPQTCDNQIWYTAALSESGSNTGEKSTPKMKYPGMAAMYRKGYYMDTDVNWKPRVINHNYGLEHSWTMNYDQRQTWAYMTDGYCLANVSRFPFDMKTFAARPFTVILDAWNSFGAIFTDYDDNTPTYQFFDESKDDPIFEGRPRVNGSMSLFATTDPRTGKVNQMPFCFVTYPYLGSAGFGLSTVSNPYGENYTTGITQTVVTITNIMSDGTPVYNQVTLNKNIKYSHFSIPINPQLSGVAVWGIKVWDRDRLVRDMIPVAKGDKIYDYVMPANGLFDKVTEIFFGNSNEGGTYTQVDKLRGPISPSNMATTNVRVINKEDILPLNVSMDWTSYGKVAINYFDYDYSYLGNRFVKVPTWFNPANTTIEDVLEWNDMKPDEFHLDGLLDMDKDIRLDGYTLEEIYDMGAVNVYYKLRTFTKSIVYYKDNVRLGSKDVFYNLVDIDEAETLDDLGIDTELYRPANFKPGRLVFNEAILAEDDVKAFIDAPAPIVVYDKYTQEENPDLFYIEYYRGGAYDDGLITNDPDDPNYLNCDLTAKVLNPKGTIRWLNHYHSAYYEDEDFGYFIPYQVEVLNKYVGLHRGPGLKYDTLAMIVVPDTYTIIEERNGWGRLKEYEKAWIPLYATRRKTGPGQNPAYDIPGVNDATIPFTTEIHISRLTIDRLWAYADEYESWIKTEEISYNQSGKLYNGLDIKVIDLKTLDFDVVNSWEDMNIYPQLKKLYYHLDAEVPEVEFSYDALSELHHVDFVYMPETYTVNCYYRTLDSDGQVLLGSEVVSYSVDDWSPDWDTYIANSWKTDETGTVIAPKIYRDAELRLPWTFFDMDPDKYRPLGSSHGIVRNNPRPWMIENKEVSFKEMIAIPAQEIFYVPFDIGMFKGTGYYGGWRANSTDPKKQSFGLKPGFTDYDYNMDVNFYFQIGTKATFLARIPVSTDIGDGYNQITHDKGSSGPVFELGPNNKTAGSSDVNDNTNHYIALSLWGTHQEMTSSIASSGQQWSRYHERLFLWRKPLTQSPIQYKDIGVLNLSNNRHNNQIVFGRKTKHEDDFEYYDTRFNRIDNTTDLTKTPRDEIANFTVPKDQSLDDLDKYWTDSGGFTHWVERYGYGFMPGAAMMDSCISYAASTFINNTLQGLYMPFPAGMILPVYGYVGTSTATINVLDFFADYPGRGGTVSLRTDDDINDPNRTKQFDVFAEQEIVSNDVSLVMETKYNTTYFRKYPDDAAGVYTALAPEKGTIFPVTKFANGYEGSPNAVGWYATQTTGDRWIRQNYITVNSSYLFDDFSAATGYVYNITDAKKTLYKDPECTIATSEKNFAVYGYEQVFWKYKNKSFYNGKAWIPYNWTDKKVTEIESKEYLVTKDTVPGYNFPTDRAGEPLQKVTNYYTGNKVMISKLGGYQNKWGWTGTAWVYMENLTPVY